MLVVGSGIVLWWVFSRHTETTVLHVTWYRAVALQKKDSHDRWVWDGIRISRGHGGEPSWPALYDVGYSFREVSRIEVYTAVLAPLEFPAKRWQFSTSDERLYTEVMDAMRTGRTVNAVGAAFGTVNILATP